MSFEMPNMWLISEAECKLNCLIIIRTTLQLFRRIVHFKI